jgi:hypothetical protein
MLNRATYEVEELDRSVNEYFMSEDEGKNKVGSLAGTCAATLWNLVDWLANTNDPATKAALGAAGLTNFEIIRNHVKARSGALTLCWEVTNGYKHCELRGFTRNASQINHADVSAASDPRHALAYRFVPKIRTNAGDNLSAVQAYKDALSFWNNFFNRLGI